MDAAYLKDVQRAGWVIEAVDTDACVARCPVQGCGMKVRLQNSTRIPQCHTASRRAITDIPIASFEELRVAMRERREELALSIRDVEDVAGMTVDYLAKFEKDDPSKIPNAQTTLEWIQALGYEVIIRPAQIPPYGLRIIAETRDRARHRRNRHRLEQQKRGSRGGASSHGEQ